MFKIYNHTLSIVLFDSLFCLYAIILCVLYIYENLRWNGEEKLITKVTTFPNTSMVKSN